jgi:hypothetical protein
MKTSQVSIILLGLILCLFSFSCISKTEDVSNRIPYRDLISKKFKTKVTCKLESLEGSQYIVAEYIAKEKNGKLMYQKGTIAGKEGVDYIKDGSVFTVEKIIRQQSFEYDYLQIIGYFDLINKNIDVRFLFKRTPTNTGTKIEEDNEFLEAVKEKRRN